MTVLYPPVLESQARSIPYAPEGELHFYEIEFQLPVMVSVENIKHVQVSLKVQATNENAVNPNSSPDRQVLYMAANGQEGGKALFGRKENSENYVVRVPYRCFVGNRPAKDVTYVCQIRFGTVNLWTGAGSGITNSGIDNFATWRNTSTAAVPSGFGEWSNAQKVYCYGSYQVNVEANFNDFVPEVIFTYIPETGVTDGLEQVKMVLIYDERVSRIYKTLVFNGQRQADGTYSVAAKIPVAPVTPMAVSVEGITQNNTLVGGILNIPPLTNGSRLYVPGNASDPVIAFGNGEIRDITLLGEEANDGCLAKSFIFGDKSYVQKKDTVDVYRTNLYSLDTVKVVQGLQTNEAVAVSMKDYSIEMGEEYIYIAAIRGENGTLKELVCSPYPWGYSHGGYGRLMKMDSVFLTTRDHQLRLQGNVQVSSLKRNTQDQFQTTIGSEYPFYSRSAKMNYRTFSLSGVVSIAFDPTATFMENDERNGLWWKDDGGNQLVILNRDLYAEPQMSLSRRRIKDRLSQGESIVELYPFDVDGDSLKQREKFFKEIEGPKSIYDDYLHRDVSKNQPDDKSDENVYLERKFRDFAMKWLSDGKPKLYRSETEGNMIVILSGISFSPLDKSGRMVYTMSATVTEIAEYNLENLLNYNLVPVDIRAKELVAFPKELQTDDILTLEDYLTLTFYYPAAKAAQLIK